MRRTRTNRIHSRSSPFSKSTMRPHLQSYYYQRSAALPGLIMLLFPVFLPQLFTPLGRAYPSLFSEWNAPKPRHLPLIQGALQHHPPLREQFELWSPLPNQGWKPCSDSVDTPTLPEHSQGYIQVFLDGGLNQQRMGFLVSHVDGLLCQEFMQKVFLLTLLFLFFKICDAVALAKILNATLIIPYLEVNRVWQDESSFADIFDVDHFIASLRDDIRIVKDLPSDYFWSTREYYATGIRETRIKTAPVHASANWYLENVLPMLHRYGIAAVSPFSHRLAFDNLPSSIQRLRCKVNFDALMFVPHIRALGDTLINRLRYPGNKKTREALEVQDNIDMTGQGAGKYIVLHLRFDKDMAAHSACDFGGGRAEKLALAKYRQVLWQGRVQKLQFTDEELRHQGRCPMTPEEIGLLLVALGFSNKTSLYLASHKVYGGEARISTLRKMFPLMEDKRSLASAAERANVEGKASVLAAVDYYVSMHSDIFISASPGNMHNAVLGYRAYKNLKTIRPNMALLGQLFMNKSLTWPDFQSTVVDGHKNRQGTIRIRREHQSIYTYPIPDCMCRA